MLEHREGNNVGKLALFAIFVGVANGGVAAAAISPIFLMFGVVAGAVLGLLISPFLVICLRDKSLLIACPTVFVGTFAATTFAASPGAPVNTMVISIGSMCALSLALYCFLPNYQSTSEHRCMNCGYNLRGNISGRCPECGRNCAADINMSHNYNRSLLNIKRAVLILTTFAAALAVTTAPWDSWVYDDSSSREDLFARLANNEATIHDAAIAEMLQQGKAPFLDALLSDNRLVRRRAVKGLVQLADPTTARFLAAMLRDRDPWTRSAAARGLGVLEGV